MSVNTILTKQGNEFKPISLFWFFGWN